MTRTIQVNLGRITHGSFGTSTPFDLIFSGLNGKIALYTNSFLYHIDNINMYHTSYKMIYGELYKSKLLAEHQVLDKRDLTYDSEIIDELYTISRFVIFADLSIVFTSSHMLKDDSFIDIFEKLYHKNAEEAFSTIKIHYRKKEFEIFDIIKSFSRLDTVKLINIRKSNPTPRPTFEKIEAFLEREKTDVLNAKFKSEKEEGLARDLDSHIMSGISIADSAYGDCIIEGQKPNGDFEIINLKDKVIRKRIEKIPIEDKERFVNLISEKFGKYISSEDDLVHD